jgi:hypothetical protein
MPVFAIDAVEYPLLLGSDEVEYRDHMKLARRWDGTMSATQTGPAKVRVWTGLRVGMVSQEAAQALYDALRAAGEVELSGDLIGDPVDVKPEAVQNVVQELADLWVVEFEAHEIGG